MYSLFQHSLFQHSLLRVVCRISVIAKKFAGSTDSIERWYGTEYSSTRLSEDVLQVTCHLIVVVVKIKVAHTRLSSVGFWS